MMPVAVETQEATTFDLREVSHAINNRLNVIALGMGILEHNDNPDVRVIANSLKNELRDLERLIHQLKQSI